MVQKNFAAVDAAVAALHKVNVPDKVTALFDILPMLPKDAPAFVHDVLGEMAAGRGDLLPVSALPPGGTFPTGPRSGRSGISRRRFLCGMRNCASSAASA